MYKKYDGPVRGRFLSGCFLSLIVLVGVFSNAASGNQKPQIVSKPVEKGQVGTAYQYQVLANDSDGDTLTYTLSSAPRGMAISAKGRITWLKPSAGTFQVTVDVTDGHGGIAIQSYTLTVILPKVIVPNVVGLSHSAAQTTLVGANLTPGVRTQQSSASVPRGHIIGQNPAPGTSVLLGSAVNLVVSVTNHNPQISSTSVNNGQVGTAYQYQVLASDLDGDILTYTLTAAPTGMAIKQTGRITWINPVPGDFQVTVAVTDGAGSAVQSYTLNVIPANVIVPNVEGLTQAAATAALIGLNLTVGAIAEQTSTFVLPGNIISQKPAAGTSVVQGTSVKIVVSQAPVIPPDPSTVAPLIDTSVASTVGVTTAFLYSGSNPIQTGVAPNTIVPTRAAVIRGKVLDKTNVPLPGVTITILNHPEFGQTISRVDGMFDLAVNGGGPLVITYAKAGFLASQRQVSVPWQDFVLAPDVILISQDTHVTIVNLVSNAGMQVARATITTDSDGTRQATLLFPQGTQATMAKPNGSSTSPTTLSVRATEYTVGPNGSLSMPAELPPTSAYTYAIELSADEAVNTGGARVTLNKPIIFHVENFLNFPTGTVVPTGYYDRDKGIWVPSDNGLVIKILNIAGGTVDLDVDGSGLAADSTALAALGVADAERQQLAAMYQPGQSLWRIPIAHFSSHDCNWGFGPPPDATPPNQPPPPPNDPTPDPCSINGGSIIECENQMLAESIGIAGTPFRLHYTTNRAEGSIATDTLNIPLSGSTIPASLTGIELEVEVAGTRFKKSFPPVPNQSFTFKWDRKDAYGRTFQGGQFATIKIGYAYESVYQNTPKFGYNAIGELISGIRTRRKVTLWQVEHASVGHFDALSQGLGGWDLSIHHWYDHIAGTLYLGDGTRQSAMAAKVITTAAGNGTINGPDEGILAILASLGHPEGVTIGPDGSLYIADTLTDLVHRVDPGTGIITRMAGGSFGPTIGDNGPATQARLFAPSGVAVGPDGSIYIADRSHSLIRRVDPGQTITTFAGGGPVIPGSTSIGDGGPAAQARLNLPQAVVLAPDGSLYIADMGNNRIRRVDPGGIITTVAGGGQPSTSIGDGGPATQARLKLPHGVAVGPDGSLFIADTGNNRIRRVDSAGIINTVAGSGLASADGDGGAATQAQLNAPEGIAMGNDGTIYIADAGNQRVRMVEPDGIITTVAGGVQNGSPSASIGDGGPATKAQLATPAAIAVGNDGTLYIADKNNHLVRRVAPSLPGMSLNDFSIASSNGAELYLFDSSGRHLQTLNALTGAIRYQFGYDSAGRLHQITDGDSNVTTINHDANGNFTIIGPFGQNTQCTVNPNGYLSSFADPGNNTFTMTYFPGGLLHNFQDPNGNISTMAYDTLGRLQKDTDASGGFIAAARTEGVGSYTVSLSTALGRTTTHQVQYQSIGNESRAITFPNGSQSELLIDTDGSPKATLADGTVLALLQGPDPRFSMQAPLPESLSTTTGGVASTVTTERSVALADPLNLLSLATLTDKITVNGRTFTREFDAGSKTYTMTTPAGRQRTTTIDAQGRVTQTQVSGLLPVNFTYDTNGRLHTITQGTGSVQRTAAFVYDSNGYLHTITDPLNRTFTFQPDAVGRVLQTTLPDGRQVIYGYDANGNLTSVTPLGLPGHGFIYNAVDLISQYTPPLVTGTGNTVFTYNTDRQLTHITRPDQKTVDFVYDCCLNKTIIARGAYIYAHDATTGRLSSVTAPDGGALSFSYNGALLTNTAWSGAVTGAISRIYDNDFRLTSLSVNGTPINFTYEADSLLTQAGGLTLTRDPQKNGLITGSVLGNESETFSYNGFGELTGSSASNSGTAILAENFNRDQLGRITQSVETIGGITSTIDYNYDIAGRLIEVKQNGTTTATYTYDSNGNRTSASQSGAITNGTYDDQDRLIQYGNTIYGYTANGDLQTETVSGQTTTYNYDELGNLLSVSKADGTLIEYVIDGWNRRIGKKVGGTLIKGFLYQDRLKPISELDGNNNVMALFVYASHSNVPDYMVKNGVTFRILTDHLGSPRLVVDVATGAIAQRMDYDEFGRVTNDTNPGFQPFGFAGGLYDEATNLVRFGLRDYDAKTGRWTTKDPIGFAAGDPNLYLYVGGNVVNAVDRYGTNNETPPPSDPNPLGTTEPPPGPTANETPPPPPSDPNPLGTTEPPPSPTSTWPAPPGNPASDKPWEPGNPLYPHIPGPPRLPNIPGRRLPTVKTCTICPYVVGFVFVLILFPPAGACLAL